MRAPWRPLYEVSRRRVAFSSLAALAILCLPAPVRASEDFAPGKTPQEFQFRRVYVPADRAQDWPTGTTPYVPVEAKEAERLLESAQTGVSGLPSTSAPQINKAQFDARLEGGDVLIGHALLDIAHKSNKPSHLPLTPCNLAVENASWADKDSAKSRLGNSVDGRFVAMIDASGQLGFDWSLRGERSSSGAVVFRWEMLSCPVSRLTLDLPPRMLVFVSHGLATPAPGAPSGLRRWMIDFGGYSHAMLRIATEDSEREQRQLTLLRQTLTYEFSPRGLDVVAQLKVDVHHEPLQRLTIDLGPQLRLVSARLGDKDIPWSADDVRNQLNRVVLELPEPLLGAGSVIRLTAVAPLVSGQPWQLPKIQPQGLFWQEGNATLLVPAPLVLEKLTTDGCRQSKTAPLPSPQVGDALEIQYFSPDAAIDVVVDRPQGRLKVESGTQLEVGPGEVSAVVVAELSVKEGEHFQLPATIPAQWQVDNVECSRQDVIADWQTDVDTRTSQKLTIRLTKALSPRNSLRLIVRAHRPFNLSELLDARDMQWLQFPGASASRALLAVRAVEGFEVSSSGGEQLNLLDALRLNASDSRLFATSPSGLLMAIDDGFSPLKVAIEPRKPSYAAEIHIDVSASGNSVAETTVLRVAPQAARLERVLVHFSHASPIRWQWAMIGGGASQISANRWTAEEQATVGLGTSGETWEIQLRAPRVEPFELKAVRTRTFNGRQPVALATLVDASAQQGLATIRALGDSGLLIKNRRLKAVRTPLAAAENYQTTRGSFRFEPTRDAMETEPLLSISPAPAAQSETGAFVWHYQLESHLALRNTADHVITYRLQTSGRQQVQIAMPSESQIRRVWVDNAPISQTAIDAADEFLTLDLPPQRKFSTIRIHYWTTASLPRFTVSFAPPLPRIDVPVMNGHWRVYLPSGYEIPESDVRWQAQSRAPLTWSQRLFGPLGRAAGGRFFQPLSRGSWLALTSTDNTEPILSAVENAPTKPTSKLPWNESTLDGTTPFEEIWQTKSTRSVYELELSDSSPPTLRVVHTWAMRVLGWGFFLILLAIVGWFGADHMRICWIAAGLLGTLAIFVPATYIPAVTPAFLAVVFCLAVFCTGQRLFLPVRYPKRLAQVERFGPAAQATALLVVGTALACGDLAAADESVDDSGFAAQQSSVAAPPRLPADRPPAQAQSSSQKHPAESPIVHKVLIPVDTDLKPTGTQYFLQEGAYNELLRREAVASEQPGMWILQSAVYRGALNREGVQKKLLLSELKAAYELQVFQSNTTVRIPLGREGLVVPADGAKLDGQPVKTEWDAAGMALLVRVSEPGTYRLELSLKPSLQSVAAGSGFEVTIPALATSKLELKLPTDVASLELPGLRGRMNWDKQLGTLTAALGPTARLSVRWPDAASQDGTMPNLEVDELLWFKVRPGSTVVDARFRFRVLEGRVRQLRLMADSRLRLLPNAAGESPIVNIHSSSDNLDLIDIELPRALTDQTSLDLTFLLTGVSGVGNVRMPRLEAVGARAAKRWLAVSIDPALQNKKKEGQEFPSVSVPDFTAAWGSSDSTPQAAYAIGRGDPNWVLATQPIEAQNSVEQTLALSFGQNQIRLKYEATLATAASYNFQIRIQAPSRLRINQLSIVEDGVQRVARWSQDETGIVTAFLSSAAIGRQQIVLTGDLPTPAGGTLKLPAVDVLDAKVVRNQLQVFRQPTMLVDIEHAGELKADAAPALDKNKLELGNLVGSYQLESPAANAVFKLSPNVPDVRLMEVISVRGDSDLWTAEVRCQMQVRGGLVDLLRFSIPPQWTGPFQLNQPATTEIVNIPGESRRQLIVRPTTPIQGDFDLTLRSPLSVASGDRLRVPDVLPLGMSHMQRYVVLPTQMELQRIIWSLSNLRPAALPPVQEGQPGNAATESLAAYLVQGERFDASLKSIERSSGVAQVRLADVVVDWTADDRYRGVISFDVDPAGNRECVLQSMPGLKLLNVTVADLAAHLLEDGENRWRLALGSPQLPQRISVVFTGRIPEGGWNSGWCRFDVPSLAGLEVERSLWTVFAPPQAGDGQSPHAVTGAAAHDLARYRSLVHTLDVPADVAAEQSSDELQRWLRVWYPRCTGARETLDADRRQLTRAKTNEIEAELAELDENLKRVTIRLSNSNAGELASAVGEPETPTRLLETLGGSRTPTLCSLGGPANSLAVRYSQIGNYSIWGQLGWLCGIASVTAAGVLVLPRRTPRLFSPAQVGMVGGTIWWLLLAPSAVGLAIASLCGAVLLRHHWLSRTGRGRT